ncbi:MAG: class I SAM-dependent methyltransferase [Candidatus Omnitrophica bacterium]|nr:class I SAM-dependent methyltransferase [Candidatus Omnitrophota bacterium]MBU1047717.1 class I SAM-dependent methyltransferase [Candidatus Omnitrophota bacterium]MBU1631094.1 class I SAM-dependent methyltransferase [Candidatus Omnitrophota bacterium]MBU1767005.1 class I SAM-dependent methyltransferase [Candidatus Omnitrophota bacterium]MBU1888553.1 class I SAM-dependent methyltransferase [Candidatus Omnitrophota bacterium]
MLKLTLTPSPFFSRNKQLPQYYKGLLAKSDVNLHAQLLVHIEKLIDAHKGKIFRVLDWGCGEGSFSQRLHDLGCEVIAVDMNKKEFKASGPKFYKLNFNAKDEVIQFIKEHSGKFDLIVSIEVIEHVENPWDFLRTLKQLCSYSTYLLITTPNISCWWSRFWFLLTGEIWGFCEFSWLEIGHINAIPQVEMVNIFREIGFSHIEVFSGGTLPIIWGYNWKRLLVSIFFLPLQFLIKKEQRGLASCYLVKR